MSLLPKKALRWSRCLHTRKASRRWGTRTGPQPTLRGRWPRATSRALLPAPRRCHPQPVPGAGVPTYLPLHALRQAPHPKTPVLPGAAVGRDKRVRKRDDPSARGPADLRGAPLPGRANTDAAATLSSDAASGSRAALCLSSVMVGDPGATSRQASSAAAGAGSLVRARADSARPAPPRLRSSQDPPQPGRWPWNSAPPSAAAALSPGRNTACSSTGPLTPLGRRASGASAHAHRRHHGRGDPRMARMHQGGGVMGAGRSGTEKRALG